MPDVAAESQSLSRPRPVGRPPLSVAQRLVWALALVPIVPAVSFVIAGEIGTAVFDEMRWFNLLTATLCLVAVILIWRAVILWTLGRMWLTALVSVIPFVQVIHGQAWWAERHPGCLTFHDEICGFGQHQLGLGVWIWCLIWVWWGWEKLHMAASKSDLPLSEQGRRFTSASAKRLAASIGSIPFVVGVFLILGEVFRDLFAVDEDWNYAPTSLVAIVVWILIWRRAVRWDSPTIKRTAVCAIYFLGLPVAAFLLWWEHASGVWETLLLMLPIIGWGLWMAVTVSIWPRRSAEDLSALTTPRCPNCGYLLKGLYATRCPECGTQPTLDELWQANVRDYV